MVKKPAPLDLPTFTRSPSSPQEKPAATSRSSASVSYAIGAAPAETAALPLLPKAKRPSFSSHRNDANAALALDLLADVQAAITEWHTALRETLLKIQKLYMAGPIIDGWLEAVNPQETQADLEKQVSLLRHGDPDQVAAYVEKLSQQGQASTAQGATQYRLCSLDADGRMQCQLCPPGQLGAISQAIARNQQLRHLVSQKQYLEARLKRAAESLDVTRQTLDIQSKATD